MSFDAVVKVGGSLAGNGSSPQPLMAALVLLARRRRLLVVPGGGPFADAVRQAFHDFALSEGVAHRMALYAMNQYGLMLAHLAPGSTPVSSLAEARSAAAAGSLPVLLPEAPLWAADPLENSWRVTGDAIAAWVATVTGARMLVLAKSIDVAGGLATSDLVRQSVVDPVFEQALQTPCWIVNGHHPDRLVQLLDHGTTTGAQVLPGPGSPPAEPGPAAANPAPPRR